MFCEKGKKNMEDDRKRLVMDRFVKNSLIVQTKTNLLFSGESFMEIHSATLKGQGYKI